MPKPTLAQRTSFKTWLRKYKTKFANTTIPEFYIDAILSEKAVGINTTDDVRVIPFNNFGTEDVTTDIANNTLFYLPALPNDTVTLSIGSSSFTFKFVGEDGGIQYNGTTYGLNDTIGISTTKVLNIKGLGGGLLQSSSTPTYSVTPSASSVDEGSSVSFTVNTNHVGAGATLYYSTGGVSVDTADFSDGSLTGSFNVVGIANTTLGIATFTRSIAADFPTESSESFYIEIRTNSTSGTIVATSSVVSIVNVAPSYSVTADKTTVDEGESVTFTITTNGVPAGSTLYWTLTELSGTVTQGDLNNPTALSGGISINSSTNNVVYITKSLKRDYETESLLESVRFDLRTGSTSGPVVASSPTIYFVDTSKTPGAEADGLTFGPVQVNRDSGVAADASDWYTICGLDSLPEGSSIALFIDTSGSMTQATIQASYDLLVSKLAAKNITITTVTNNNEDWITPFLVDLP